MILFQPISCDPLKFTRKEFDDDDVFNAYGSYVDIQELKFKFDISPAPEVEHIELQNYISYTCHNKEKIWGAQSFLLLLLFSCEGSRQPNEW